MRCPNSYNTPVAKPYECRAYTCTFTHFNQRRVAIGEVYNPPAQLSPGWAFIKLLLDTCQWVQTNNYAAWE